MILEIDCGNSFIKWRILEGSVSVAGGVVDSDLELISAVSSVPAVHIKGCRLVSVRSDDETQSLIASVTCVFGVEVVLAEPSRFLAGVTNGYDEYARLGMDRWLALVGGFQLAKGACLVLDFGTAITADYVSGQGQHMGGFICPGIALMRGQLQAHTRRIRYDSQSAEHALQLQSPGRTTVEAVERGCLLMVRGFVLTQLELAQQYWGDDFTVFLTGGDASLVKDMVPEARLVHDLVFVGLAAACPLP